MMTRKTFVNPTLEDITKQKRQSDVSKEKREILEIRSACGGKKRVKMF